MLNGGAGAVAPPNRVSMPQIGRYEILEELGRGGFGRVFRGNDPLMKREVAIKVMAAANDPDMLARFRNEAASAGRLRHENIVTIYDFGEERGVPYIVMEYLRGLDLQKTLARKTPLSLLEKLRMLCQVASGLQAAHEAGIIHRDVKPANIMVLPDKSVKIMDFGIARVTQQDATRHTRTGLMVGTLAYLSPELFEGAPADAMADLWAYGVIAYQLLAGVNPLEGSDDAQIIYRITATQVPDIGDYAPDLPEDLRAVTNRLVQRKRMARYQSFEDVRIELNPILERLDAQDAMRLVDQARVLAARGDLNTGHMLVRQVLEKHPSNSAARQLRDQIVTQIRTNDAKQQVLVLVQNGDAEMAAGRIEEALARYEQACRILPGDSTSVLRLERAKELLERARKIRTDLNRARVLRSEGKLEEARNAVTAILDADPDNGEARALSEQIQQEIQRGEESRLAEAVLRSRSLMAQQKYDEAIAVLDECASQMGDHPELRAATEDVRREARQQAEERRIAGAISQANLRLQSGKYEETIDLLKPLAAKDPNNPQIQDLLRTASSAITRQTAQRAREEALQRAREESARRAREEAEQRAREEAEQRAREEAEERAREEAQRAREASAQRARDEAAQRARDEAAQQPSGHLTAATSAGLVDRAKVIAKALDISRERERQGKLDEALHVLDVALSRLPDARELIAERDRLMGRPAPPPVRDTAARPSSAAAQRTQEAPSTPRPPVQSASFTPQERAPAASEIRRPPAVPPPIIPREPPRAQEAPSGGGDLKRLLQNRIVLAGAAALVVLSGPMIYCWKTSTITDARRPPAPIAQKNAAPDSHPVDNNKPAEPQPETITPPPAPPKEEKSPDQKILAGQSRYSFDYQRGAPPPGPIEVPVTRKDFRADVRPAVAWLRATNNGGRLFLRADPRSLNPQDYSAKVQVTSGNRTESIDVSLKVRPEAAKKADVPGGPTNPSQGQQGPKPSQPATWLGDFEGDATWRGNLPAGGRLVLNAETVQEGGGFLKGWGISPQASTISISAGDPTIGVQTSTAGGSRVVFTNNGQKMIGTIRFHWSFKM